jgi:hypothetical protein
VVTRRQLKCGGINREQSGCGHTRTVLKCGDINRKAFGSVMSGSSCTDNLLRSQFSCLHWVESDGSFIRSQRVTLL